MLSEKSIQEIENAIGVKGLLEAIKSDDVQDIVLTKTKHFNEASYNDLVNNLTDTVRQEKAEEIKKIGIEQALKNIRKAKGYEFEGKSIESLVEYLEGQKIKSTETGESKIKQEYEKDIASLKLAIAERDKKIETTERNYKNQAIDREIDNHFNSLPLEIPSHIKDEAQATEYLRLEKERNKIFFKSQYEFDIDVYNKIIPLKNGQVIKDETLNPVSVGSLVQDYAKSSFMQIKQVITGRGEGDRLPKTQTSNFKDVNEAVLHYEKKGLKIGTSEMDAVIAEFYNKK